MQDVWLLEKLAHFDREVIPERRMHAKGSGAFGTFTVTNDITQYTRAKFLSEVGNGDRWQHNARQTEILEGLKSQAKDAGLLVIGVIL